VGNAHRQVGGTVAFDVPREIAFDFLADPRNRPRWQSSLKQVDEVSGTAGVGQTWVDVTRVGARPRMRTTAVERPRTWAESGVWHGLRGDLTLRFDATVRGCLVRYRFRVVVLGPLGLVVSRLAVPAVRADLRRAARLLSPGSGTSG
jgi:uncharacterized protein YndB with AHSA1/START domain